METTGKVVGVVLAIVLSWAIVPVFSEEPVQYAENTARYRSFGTRDPFNSIIIEKRDPTVTKRKMLRKITRENIYLNIKGYRSDPLRSLLVKEKSEHTPVISEISEEIEEKEKIRVPSDIYEILEKCSQDIKTVIRKRELWNVVRMCTYGLGLIKGLEQEKMKSLVQEHAVHYKNDFIRWAEAAQEGLMQIEADNAFTSLDISLEGIMWDEFRPFAIIDGRSFKEKDQFMGILIHKIEKEKVSVFFSYKKRQFNYILDLE